MPTRKIADDPNAVAKKAACYHPDHNVASHQVFEPGTYEHTCGGCGRKHTFTVHGTECRFKVQFTDDGNVQIHDFGDDDSNPMHSFGHGRGD